MPIFVIGLNIFKVTHYTVVEYNNNTIYMYVCVCVSALQNDSLYYDNKKFPRKKMYTKRRIMKCGIRMSRRMKTSFHGTYLLPFDIQDI